MTSKSGRSHSVRSPHIGGPLSQSLSMIPPTMHGHEFNQPLSRVIMVRKTDQRTFSKGRRGAGGEPLLETVTRETVELFNGGRTERKFTSETRDVVTPKNDGMQSLNVSGTKKKVVAFVDQLHHERSRAESVRSKSPMTASPASPGPLSNSFQGSFHGSLGSDGMSCSSARSSPDSARWHSTTQITKTETRKPSVRRSGATKEFINLCLETHNYFRARHGVPPLRLSKQLCKTSQDWANVLATRGKLEHRANSEYGENLYCLWSSNPKTIVNGDEPVNEWYAEEVQHHYGKEPMTLKTGHFTQIVWQDSTEFGVGMSRNRNGEVYVVCNYNPAGNFLGSFMENVLPPVGSLISKTNPVTNRVIQSPIDQHAWQQEALAVHNEYRRRHRSSDLRLSAELTTAAKAWASTLLNTNKLVPQSSSPFGENIYSMQCSDPHVIVSAREVVAKWYSERKDHKYGIEPRILNTCHFTQIVWRDTTEMGIAMAKKDGTCVVVACYHPRGNIVGHFVENVLKPSRTT
ncbi:hypothetical protein HCN44_010527 [Aphidius gifuensis]|uniref:SCP domain-containing protein n=1 Tax=Aphidius gifuensis TaxID=684658 RepID=A0A834XVT1_APHGI|nr:uncharacterized protein LOC122855631 isoform X3 [Aphidius gifuensis]KAF7991726.1 hypothetical protein HCN44_010527 [Aphidius gifuensis]